MVTHRRRCLFPLYRPQKVMDYPDASRHWFHDALDVVYSPRINGRCLCILFQLALRFHSD
jgi:hypothetical protein